MRLAPGNIKEPNRLMRERKKKEKLRHLKSEALNLNRNGFLLFNSAKRAKTWLQMFQSNRNSLKVLEP